MRNLTLQDLLAPPPEKIDIPELGGCVYARPMSGAIRFRLQREHSDDELDQARLLIRNTICDETGAPMFNGTGDPAELPALVLDRLITECMRVNGLQADAVAQAEKNSETT